MNLEFRDPVRARELTAALARAVAHVGRSPVSVMHVCGSHEQAIAKFGLRAVFPRDLDVIMGPGCPVCITDMPEIDEGVALARQGGSGVFEPFVARHHIPVVVAGFEPLDILAGLVKLVELIRDDVHEVVNMFPRCVTRDGNRNAQQQLWRVFRPTGGRWRGIAHVPNGNLRLRDEWAPVDARRRFTIDTAALWDRAPSTLVRQCICGNIMAGIAQPSDCPHFGKACVPESPVGACMVSSEGTCKIWHQYGGVPDLGGDAA